MTQATRMEVAHSRDSVGPYFLCELASIQEEARVLVESSADERDALPMSAPPSGLEIYDRYEALRRLILVRYPSVTQCEWERPARSAFLERADLLELQANAVFLKTALLARLMSTMKPRAHAYEPFA